MKTFVIIKVARQINGELVFVKVEKAFKDQSKAEQYLIGKNTTIEKIETKSGHSVECSCEIGIFDVEIEE